MEGRVATPKYATKKKKTRRKRRRKRKKKKSNKSKKVTEKEPNSTVKLTNLTDFLTFANRLEIKMVDALLN